MSWRNTTAIIARQCMRAFGEPVRYSPRTGAPFACCAIYDPVDVQVGLPTEQETDSIEHVFGFESEVFTGRAAPRADDRITVAERFRAGTRERTFVVKRVDEDGWAGYRLACFESREQGEASGTEVRGWVQL